LERQRQRGHPSDGCRIPLSTCDVKPGEGHPSARTVEGSRRQRFGTRRGRWRPPGGARTCGGRSGRHCPGPPRRCARAAAPARSVRGPRRKRFLEATSDVCEVAPVRGPRPRLYLLRYVPPARPRARHTTPRHATPLAGARMVATPILGGLLRRTRLRFQMRRGSDSDGGHGASFRRLKYQSCAGAVNVGAAVPGPSGACWLAESAIWQATYVAPWSSSAIDCAANRSGMPMEPA